MLWKFPHGPLPEYTTPISQPVWLSVGIEDHPGVVKTGVHLWGTLEKISTYISPLINICTCTFASFFILFVFIPLQAEICPIRFNMNMNKTYPASMWSHEMAMEGTHSQPGHA